MTYQTHELETNETGDWDDWLEPKVQSCFQNIEDVFSEGCDVVSILQCGVLVRTHDWRVLGVSFFKQPAAMSCRWVHLCLTAKRSKDRTIGAGYSVGEKYELHGWSGWSGLNNRDKVSEIVISLRNFRLTNKDYKLSSIHFPNPVLYHPRFRASDPLLHHFLAYPICGANHFGEHGEVLAEDTFVNTKLSVLDLKNYITVGIPVWGRAREWEFCVLRHPGWMTSGSCRLGWDPRHHKSRPYIASMSGTDVTMNQRRKCQNSRDALINSMNR